MQRAEPVERRKLEQIEAEIAAAEQRIAREDERMIAAVRNDRDISESENKVMDAQRSLEDMRARRRRLMRKDSA